MSKRLGLEMVKDGVGRLLTEFSLGRITLGREPEGSGAIRIESGAVSRTHAEIKPIRSHWFFSDCGSTNGSWLNGERANKDELILLRPGDTLQLADTVLRVVNRGGTFPPPSVIVFEGGELVDEFPIPEFGKVMSVGGTGGSLELPGDMESNPTLVFEVRGGKVAAYQISKAQTVHRNGVPLSQSVFLEDNDKLTLGTFLFVFQTPPSDKEDGGTAVLRSWEGAEEKENTGGLAPVVASGFGRADAEGSLGPLGGGSFSGAGGPVSGAGPISGTVAMKPAEIAEYLSGSLPPARKPSGGQPRRSTPKSKVNISSRELALILFIATTFMVTVGLLLWFLGSN